MELWDLYYANGNLAQLVNTGGEVVAHYEYDPFGNLTAKAGPYADANQFRFSTKYFDGDTGLYDFGLRDYSVKLGRWTSRDPIEEEGGVNLYAFIKNDPTNAFDIFGLISGPSEIIALDKNYPATQTKIYSESSKVCWKTSGVLAIDGPNDQKTVLVYPTGESASKNDSKVIAHTASGDKEIEVTVRRPLVVMKTFSKMSSGNIGLGVILVAVKSHWQITDQFHDPMVGVLVTEKIDTLVSSRLVNPFFVKKGSAVTNSDGKVEDTYGDYYFGKSGYRGFKQTIIVGNWEAEIYGILYANGLLTGNRGAVFH